MHLFLKFAMHCLKLHMRLQKKLHCLCPNGKPNQQLRYRIRENQPTYMMPLLGIGMKHYI